MLKWITVHSPELGGMSDMRSPGHPTSPEACVRDRASLVRYLKLRRPGYMLEVVVPGRSYRLHCKSATPFDMLFLFEEEDEQAE